MKCPHCLVEINPNFVQTYIGNDKEGYWFSNSMKCPNPNCKKLIIQLNSSTNVYSIGSDYGANNFTSMQFVRPLVTSRSPVPTEVDDIFANDYKEACLIFNFSPKACAALSRRCLQNILREKSKVKHGNLANEIQQVIDSGLLPSHLSESIDAVRNIGNFAAHPLKSTSTGEIIDVEPGEAEWLLDVIESLFDFYFVQPEIIKRKKEALNKKLKEIGKPEMK